MQTYVIMRRGGWKSAAAEPAAARARELGDGEMSDDIRWIRELRAERGRPATGDRVHLPGLERRRDRDTPHARTPCDEIARPRT